MSDDSSKQMPVEPGRPNDAQDPRKDLNKQYAPYIVSPLVNKDRGSDDKLAVIIDPNLDYIGGQSCALGEIENLVRAVGGEVSSLKSRSHFFATLTRAQLTELLKLDQHAQSRSIYKIWRDTKLEAHLDRSVKLVKADASVRAFNADGRGIVWAVVDSGIDENHPHFATYKTLVLEAAGASTAAQAQIIGPVEHRNFTTEGSALTDEFGHGTHVAGIIAGATPCDPSLVGDPAPAKPGAVRLSRVRDEDDTVRLRAQDLAYGITGVSPRCKLVSLKVLGADGSGDESALLAALDYVDELNADGKRLRVHGVNISVGYPFDAEWFAAGQSPACVAVNRLVAHGVVVVVSAGNAGSVLLQTEGSVGVNRFGLGQSIADPGNAEDAITVGSTHPESPHTYGISYFSSRGPTADGRTKPDLVAPGERILSCASASAVNEAQNDPMLDEPFVPELGVAYYREESGTSMAAPHVSGACAGFLSVHKEFIGQPGMVKAVFRETATSLARREDFQGQGLLDLLRAIQSR